MNSVIAKSPVAKTVTKTALDPTIAGLTWGEDFEIGIGINAVTGVVSAKAVTFKNLVPSNTQDSITNYSLVSTEKEMEQQVEVAASGKYNMDGVKLGASASFLNKIAYSETAVTLVAKFEEYGVYYEQAEQYSLSPDAKKLIDTDRDKFRSIYGDYFVSGQKMGSSFLAVYTCQTTNKSDMTKFKASFSASAPEVFEAEGSTAFETSAKENNVSVTVNIYMNGISDTPPNFPTTPAGVLQALQWFKDHKADQPLSAKLTHYSALDNQFSPTIDIAPEIFVALKQLYSARWIMKSHFNSLPIFYRNQYELNVGKVEDAIIAFSNILPTDGAKRASLINDVTNMIGNLKDVLDRQDFYLSLNSEAQNEPSKGDVIKEQKDGQQRWLYGYNTYPKSNAVQIHCKEINVQEAWHSGYRNKTIEFGPDENYLIVGWEVVSNWGDGSAGSWSKASDQIILASYGAVYLKSKFDRGLNWTIRFYYVDAKDYEFAEIVNGNISK